MVRIPEIAKGGGWAPLIHKLARFVEEGSKGSQVKKSYVQAARIQPWSDLPLPVPNKSNGDVYCGIAQDCYAMVLFLKRCLVGRVRDLDAAIPTKEAIDSWVRKKWKTPGEVQVKELNDKFFLFEFPPNQRQTNSSL